MQSAHQARVIGLCAVWTLHALAAPGAGHCMQVGRRFAVAMIVADSKFRDEELLQPLRLFNDTGCRVTIVSSTTNEVTGMLGARVRPQTLLTDVDVKQYDAIIFVGGTGAQAYWDDARCHAIARAAMCQGKVLGAICIAPVILARAGVLAGKRATVFSSVKQELAARKIVVENDAVVTDGTVVTADGPDSAVAFGHAILAALRAQASQR